MNTWFGFRDRAYSEAIRAFPPDAACTDRRATFRGLLRLDHLFFRLEDGWTAGFQRADDRYDSDHYPLVGTVRFATSGQLASSAGSPLEAAAAPQNRVAPQGIMRALPKWASLLELRSARTMSSRSLVPAAWARCTARRIRGSLVKSR